MGQRKKALLIYFKIYIYILRAREKKEMKFCIKKINNNTII